ncbi:alanine racemase [hydrocarbon metagenome]|uniref:Alanine racemase n=1 Tax=hydrocarbon metagenome TaxID=938273 RepID=A0A0W8FVW7_9ZZZZ
MSIDYNHPTISEDEKIIRPTKVEVNLSILAENFSAIKKFVAPAKVNIVLKANAYGHGLVRVAKLLQEIGADYLSVAVVEEGILLRKAGINIPILVLGGVWGNQVPLFINYDLHITASSLEKVKQINEISTQLKKKAKVHIKIDTGMERIGVHYYNAEKFLEAVYKCENILVEGIYSHFANADSTDLTHTKLQFERFQDTLQFFEKHSIATPIRHVANSGAVLQMPETFLDMVRPGILFYGVYPSKELPKVLDVKPALAWKSLVVYFKVIKPGHPVGYGLTWQSDKNIRAVTVPVGYGDGYLRRMSNKAKVLLNGKLYPVIGLISMDQIVVNIGDNSAFNGDEVLLLGSDGTNSITAEDLAEWAGTIPYEILTNINTRVPRIYK